MKEVDSHGEDAPDASIPAHAQGPNCLKVMGTRTEPCCAYAFCSDKCATDDVTSDIIALYNDVML